MGNLTAGYSLCMAGSVITDVRSPTTMNSILLIYRQINLASKELSLRTSKR